MTKRLGEFCFRHRWPVLIVWLGVLVGGFLAAGPVFDSMGNARNMENTEVGKASQALRAAADRGDPVIALWEGVEPTAATTRQSVERLSKDLMDISGMKEVAPPIPAKDGKGVAIIASPKRLEGKAKKEAIRLVETRLRALSGDVAGSTVRIGGEPMDEQINKQVEQDLNGAELKALPLTAIVLIFVFGAVIAAGLPLLAAVATTMGAFGVLLAFSKFVDLDSSSVTVVTLLGLGLSIDYGLLLVGRYREEITPAYADGRTPTREDRLAAAGRAWGTAGRTILFSALTVAAALTGLLFFELERMPALGAAGISAALVAMLAALTLTAALLGVLGKWVKPSRKARKTATAAAPANEDRGFFAGLARLTQRRPWLVAIGTTALLLVAGAPLLSANIKVPNMEGLPPTLEGVQVDKELSNRYGQSTAPALRVVARMSPAALDAYAARWGADPAVERVEKAKAAGGDLATVALKTRGDAQGADAKALVHRVRGDRPSGVESWVTGEAAGLVDINAAVMKDLPLAITVTVLSMLVLLFLMTGSLVVPLKAIVANALSLAATFGVLIMVFQHGWLAGPLDTLTIGGLSPFVMVIVFAFGFGLSMDYEVFLLGRVKEYVDRGHDTNTAVRRGLQRSGRIITSAALLMLIVFAGFGAAKMGDIEQIGVGLFVAVLVDATIVRCLLVPATMTILGRANWWAPAPLKRFHARFGLHESAPPATPVEKRELISV